MTFRSTHETSGLLIALLRLYKTRKVIIVAASKNWHALLVQNYKYCLDLVAEKLPLVLDLVRVCTLVPVKQVNRALTESSQSLHRVSMEG
jgi:hypothetical protein